VRIEIKLTSELVERYNIMSQTFDERISVFGWPEKNFLNM